MNSIILYLDDLDNNDFDKYKRKPPKRPYAITKTKEEIQKSLETLKLNTKLVKTISESVKCPCGGTYKSHYKRTHNFTNRHLEYENKEVQTVHCECGGRYSPNYKLIHIKSVRHQNYLQSK